MILHDSHNPAFRDPIGPVPVGGQLTVRLVTDESYTVFLRTWDGAEKRTQMHTVSDGFWEATVSVPASPMLFWYDFIVSKPDGDVLYGNAPDQLGGRGAILEGAPRSYQVTVYDPAFTTPAWLREGTIYQIFPDRFRRGQDHADAARLERIAQAHPEATFHDRWDEPPTLDLDPENGDNRALDFFGGTLSGTDGLGDWNIPWSTWGAGNADG